MTMVRIRPARIKTSSKGVANRCSSSCSGCAGIFMGTLQEARWPVCPAERPLAQVAQRRALLSPWTPRTGTTSAAERNTRCHSLVARLGCDMGHPGHVRHDKSNGFAIVLGHGTLGQEHNILLPICPHGIKQPVEAPSNFNIIISMEAKLSIFKQVSKISER